MWDVISAFWLQHAPVLSVLLPVFTAVGLLLIGDSASSGGTPRPSSMTSSRSANGSKASPMRTPCSARVRRVTQLAPASIALRTKFHTA